MLCVFFDMEIEIYACLGLVFVLAYCVHCGLVSRARALEQAGSRSESGELAVGPDHGLFRTGAVLRVRVCTQ